MCNIKLTVFKRAASREACRIRASRKIELVTLVQDCFIAGCQIICTHLRLHTSSFISWWIAFDSYVCWLGTIIIIFCVHECYHTSHSFGIELLDFDDVGSCFLAIRSSR